MQPIKRQQFAASIDNIDYEKNFYFEQHMLNHRNVFCRNESDLNNIFRNSYKKTFEW